MHIPYDQQAHIVTKRTEILRHRYRYEFEWEGDEDKAVWLSADAVCDACRDTGQQTEYLRLREAESKDEMPETLNCYPWPLRLVYQDRDFFITGGGFYVRTDVKNWRGWFARIATYRVKQYLSLLRCRLIMTAMVWRLAHVPQGVEPQWLHLHISRWLKQRRLVSRWKNAPRYNP